MFVSFCYKHEQVFVCRISAYYVKALTVFIDLKDGGGGIYKF